MDAYLLIELSKLSSKKALEPEYALVPASQALVYWADEIVVQNAYQKEQVQDIIDSLPEYCQKKLNKTEIKVLNISDSHAYMSEELIRLVMEKYNVS